MWLINDTSLLSKYTTTRELHQECKECKHREKRCLRQKGPSQLSGHVASRKMKSKSRKLWAECAMLILQQAKFAADTNTSQ